MSSRSERLAARVRVHSFHNDDAPRADGDLFCLAGAGANPIQFSDLAQACAGRWRVHAFHAIDFTLEETEPACEAAHVAEAFVQAMRHLAAPPYRLLGHSAGAFVAYELARALPAHDWEQLLIVDAYLPLRENAENDALAELDTPADLQRTLHSFVHALALQIPALDAVRSEFDGLAWSEAPAHLSRTLRKHGLLLSSHDMAVRLAHFRHYTGFRFVPRGLLSGGKTRLVHASDSRFLSVPEDRDDRDDRGDRDNRGSREGRDDSYDIDERRGELWHAGFDAPPTLHRVPGDHFSMLRRPHAEALAALVV